MKSENFQAFLSALAQLTPYQRSLLAKHLRELEHASIAQTLIEERLSNQLACPKCTGTHIVRWGSASKLQRYRCRDCKATFNALTGTPLARLRLKEKWLPYSQQLIDGQSIRRSADTCHVHQTTAFRWRHRFLTQPNLHKPTQLNGIIESDETFFRESFKGQRHGLTRPAHRRGKDASKRGQSSEQIPVLVCRDRSGTTSDYVLEKDDQKHITQALKPILARDCILCSDSSKAMAAAAREIGVAHRPVNLSAGIRVIARVYHVQNVNAYDSRLKEWMRRFHGVATRYLPNYLGWRRILDATNQALSASAILNAALGVWQDQQLTRT